MPKQLWYQEQNPSGISDFNNSSGIRRLPDICDRFEVTLNGSWGSESAVTHPLAVPPVQCVPGENLKLLTIWCICGYSAEQALATIQAAEQRQKLLQEMQDLRAQRGVLRDPALVPPP